MGRSVAFLLVAACLLQPSLASAQGMSGDLIGTVRDAQGGVLPDAAVRVSSPALIGGTVTSTTNEKGQLRFQALPPGVYTLDVELKGFAPYHVPDISVGAGSTIEVAGHSDRGEQRVSRSRGNELAHRRKRPGIRDALHQGGSSDDPDASSEHVRLDQSRPWDQPQLAYAAAHRPPCLRSGPVPTRINSCSTARISPAPATVWPDPNQASISFRKSKSSRSGRRPSSAMFRAPSSTSSQGKAASGFSTTPRTTPR